MTFNNIVTNFNKLKEKEPYWGDVIVFNTVITYKKVGKMLLNKAFTKLVSKDDYFKSEKDAILEHSYKLSMERPMKIEQKV